MTIVVTFALCVDCPEETDAVWGILWPFTTPGVTVIVSCGVDFVGVLNNCKLQFLYILSSCFAMLISTRNICICKNVYHCR